MRILKSNPVLTILNSYLVDSPQPSTISYLWNFGSLLGLALVTQIISGILLAMHYAGTAELAFNSVEHIMRDVQDGWLLRYVHGAPCNSISWKIRVNGYKYPYFLLILVIALITFGIGKQLVKTDSNDYREINHYLWGGWIYVKNNELETPFRSQYADSSQARISRKSTFLYSLVRGTEEKSIRNVGIFINIKKCKWLKYPISGISKAWEITASRDNLITMRVRNYRISTWRYNINRNIGIYNSIRKYSMKDNSSKLILNKPTLKKIKGKQTPDLKINRRESIPISSWLSKELAKYIHKNDKKYNGVIHILSNPLFLFSCYKLIRGKPGNMTKGIDEETLDGIKWQYFENLGQKIKKGLFNFKPARRIEIPKTKGGNRGLNIASPRDKIVQKGLTLILENIFEPIFLPVSHGFRWGYSVHSALESLYIQGENYIWAINGDISKCFDSIPHNILIKLISKKLKCSRTIEIITKAIKQSYVLNKIGSISKVKPNTGTPQGSVLSPILSNIVLHELDIYMSLLKTKFKKGKARAVNPKYHTLNNTRYRTKNLELKKKNLKLMMNMNPSNPIDPNFRRLLYVRYADDFVVLLISSLQDAYTIRRQIRDFLNNKLGLKLNVDKTSIVSIRKGFEFLGAHISSKKKVISIVNYKSKEKNKKKLRRRFSRRLYVAAPLKKLVEKLIKNGFAKRNHLSKVLAKGRGDLINHSHYQIIKFFSARIYGILNFYSFASNFAQLRRIIWILEQSCALTLAKKHKLKTLNKVFTKFGRLLEDPLSNITLPKLGNMKVKHEYKKTSKNIHDLDKLMKSSYQNTLTEIWGEFVCALCGSKYNVEIHHLRKVSDIRAKIRVGNSTYNQWKGAFQRKQIPLCNYHHQLLHNGELSPADFSRLRNWTKNYNS